MSEERIVRYSADELRAMRERGESQTDWARVAAMTDEELEALIADDPDEILDPIDLAQVIPVAGGSKTEVTIPVDDDVLAWFRAQGPLAEWRMSAALRAHMQAKTEA